jgi:hypothetical protein
VRLSTLIATVVTAVAVLTATACGGGPSPVAPSGSQPTSSQPTTAPASSGGGGGASSQTAASAVKATPATAAKLANSGGGAAAGLEKVNMPSGSAFDPYKPIKVGDVIELPNTGIVLQVTGAKTADYDAQRNLLLVDLILGNKSDTKLTISSVLMMEGVTSDWCSYSLNMDELFQAAAKMSALNVTTFDGEVPAGEARKGTAFMLVPKDAKGLGFAFYPSNLDAGTSDPLVYVGLGINGDFAFPIVPEGAESLKAGTTYKVGQPVKAPKRGVGIQVNSARERTQSLPDLEVNVADKLVIVDITTRLFGTATEVLDKELRLVDSDGNYFDTAGSGIAAVVLQSSIGIPYSPDHRRGVLIFSGPRDSKGFKLVFTPTADEKIEFDLGTLAQDTSAPASGGASTQSAPAGPKLVDASVLAAELKSIPLPQGFGVVDGSAYRHASGGAFESASAQLFGKMSIKDLSSFYKTALAKEWDINDEDVSTGYLQNDYLNKKDQDLILYLNAEETDKGTTVDISVEKG